MKSEWITQHLFNVVIALVLQNIIDGWFGFFVALGLILLSYLITKEKKE